MDTISEYIDFSDNEDLWKEAESMDGLGQSIFEEGIEQGIGKGVEVGIKAMIEENLEEQVPKGKIVDKLQRHFKLEREKAEEYYERFAAV